MPIPETTSAEELKHYHSGKCLIAGVGRAWKEVKAFFYVQPESSGIQHVPSVNEPILHWVKSGEAKIQERDLGGPWIFSRVRRGSFFLTVGGSSYDCRWNVLSKEPFQFMIVSIDLAILQEALREVIGNNADCARLRNISGFEDEALNTLMEQLYAELIRRKASRTCVMSIGRMIAVHLIRNYTTMTRPTPHGNSALPGYKLRQITAWMAEHFAENFKLDQLAARANQSKFHFHRLFKNATGTAPSQYHIQLRMNAAKRLLRETPKSVMEISLEMGYSNPSHFARLFRRDTGLSPSDYRRQR